MTTTDASAGTTQSPPAVDPHEIASRFATEALREQRLARRWGIFFKFMVLLYVLAFIALSIPTLGSLEGLLGKDVTALVEIRGVISDEGEASADRVARGLRAAFEDSRTRGVIIRLNTPGGSPVQSGYINDEIYRLKEKHPDIPVYAVVSDICASGGYYVAVAADEIYADKASIVGSIGVRMDGFGFVEAIDKLGVERRLLTAGEHKAFLDPFSPLRSEDTEHVEGLLAEIHDQFINTVKRGRGDRLSADSKIFSGYVWSGETALAMGLVDALGSAGFVARDVIGAEKIVNFTIRDTVVDQLARRLGAAVVNAVTSGAARLR